ncbi:Copia protein, partial [Mucuna pruriens]
MKDVFEMTDLGLMNYFLGMKINQKKNDIFICQKKYAKEILKKFQLDECKIMNTPMNQKEKFSKEDGADKVDEVHFRSSFNDMRSTSGYYFSMGSGVFSWCSKKQEVVTQSTAEVEFITAIAVVNQVIWLRNILIDLGLKQDKSTKVFVDNQAAISISQNLVFHGKTKHFNMKLFHLREVQENGDASLVYCRTEDQAANMFTKPFPLNRFEFLRKKLGVCSLHGKEEC